VVESAPAGVPLVAPETYYYIVSPIPWILGGLLVVTHRLVTEEATPRPPVPEIGAPAADPDRHQESAQITEPDQGR
jgi:hypothetical protein